MATILVSDFRGKQLIHCKNTSDFAFITEDTAENTWFTTEATSKLAQLAINMSNVIIMLGFNDCVFSCVWNNFDLNKAIVSYVNKINDLVRAYPSASFYVCSVNPIETDYPFVTHKSAVIPKALLDEKIKRFNSKIQEMCDATFVDSYTYLTNTGFITRDGIRYTQDSCDSLVEYILSRLGATGGVAFTPRLTAPIVSTNIAESDLFWLGDSYGGLNPLDHLGQKYAKCTGDTLPNCTAYAWGRFYEILGSRPNLSINNAERWFLKTSDGYARGQEPALGAVICWQRGPTVDSDGNDGAGHVAIVEQINPDGSIITSESGWGVSKYWWLKRRVRGADGNWGAGSDYKFQGFIYCPIETSTVHSTVTKDSICTKNSFSISLTEMEPNALYIWQYLSAKGWSVNAVAGLLGNLQQESKMSPAIWESVIDGSTINSDGTQDLNMVAIGNYYTSHGRYPGYGLVQWTPYHKYTKWCRINRLPYWDMDSQLSRIVWEAENGEQWIAKPRKGYDLTFNEFITSTRDAAWLAGAFAFCYERPGRSTGTQAEQDALRAERGSNGEYWYNFLCNVAPATADTKIYVKDLKINNCTATTATVSFLARNIKKAVCMLNTDHKQDVLVGGDIVVFNIENLTPNTDYNITLLAEGMDGITFTESLAFTTMQSTPEAISSIVLQQTGNNMTCEAINFSVSPVVPNFGYWCRNEHGYTIQLIINGQVRSEKTTSTLVRNAKLSDYFSYNLKPTDVVQVGVRTWAVDDANKKVYDGAFVKTSAPICFAQSSVIAYINYN